MTDVVLRPDTATYRGWVGRVSPAQVLLVLVLVGSAAGTAVAAASDAALGVVLLLLLVVVSAGGALGGVVLSMRTSRVVLTPAAVEHHRWWVRHTVLPLGDDLTGLLAVFRPPFESRTSPLLVLRRRGAGPRIRLNGAFWSRADLVRIAEHAGAAVEIDREYSGPAFERRMPGALTLRERRPFLFVVTFALTVFLLAVAAAWVATGV